MKCRARPCIFRIMNPATDESRRIKFRVYSGYFGELESLIASEYGYGDERLKAIRAAVLREARATPRQIDEQLLKNFDHSFSREWSTARKIRREASPAEFDADFSCDFIASLCHFAMYHGITAFSQALRSPVGSHKQALSLITRSITSGHLPFPWNCCCANYGRFDVYTVCGLDADHTVATFLRTTRQKGFERVLKGARRKQVRPGRSSRQLSEDEKDLIARSLRPTTPFDLLTRLRIRSHYDDPDLFVSGPSSPEEASRFADSLVSVMDATLLALDTLTERRFGPEPLVKIADKYLISRPDDTLVAKRRLLWSKTRTLAHRV